MSKESKPITFMETEKEQDKLFQLIESDIRGILSKYGFKKVVTITGSLYDTGEIIVAIQEDFPSQLISELNSYIGVSCMISKSTHSINLTWRLE